MRQTFKAVRNAKKVSTFANSFVGLLVLLSTAGASPSAASTAAKCNPSDWCQQHGHAPDACNCGVCGSFGGCTFSCTPGDGRVACPGSAPPPPPTPSSRVALDGADKLAVCLDGSAAAMYVSPGSNPKGMYIYHQGGGWCQTPEECAQRALTPLGSSASYAPTKDLRATQTHVFMTRDPAVNFMSDWTFVWLPYCDGGSFAGDSSRNSSSSSSGGKLQFRGKRIREAAIATLKATVGFGAITDLVVGGCSAGGAAAYMHADWYAAQAPAGAKVRAMPDSGWFVDGDYARDGKPDYGARMAEMYGMIGANASLSAACVAALGHRCLFAPSLVGGGYVSTPLFALNSRYDASMASGQYGAEAPGTTMAYSCTSYSGHPCDAASVNTFGAYVAAAMKKALMAPPHGAFLDSCYRHCSINCAEYDITIGGVRAAQAAAAWYRGENSSGAFYDGFAPYPCANCCN